MTVLRLVPLMFAGLFWLSSTAQAAAVFVSGEVPDWNQPYTYVGPPDGPGPNPTAGADPFDAWCAPASASNLLGHWEDVRGVPVADGVAFSVPGAPIPWPAPPIWHDWNLGDPRPAPGASPAPMDADVGWYMDTNNSGSTMRANLAHVGTYTKDIHVGLRDLIVQAAAGAPGVGIWSTGTRGASFALGSESSGVLATAHPSAASAFAEIVTEINANRTVLVSWSHWNVGLQGTLAALPGASDESQFGGDYYGFLAGPPPADPWGNDEEWSEGGQDPKLTLGHVTTAVGYIAAGDPDDINAPQNPTDWVIVHDNAAGTARNVIVPLTAIEYAANWVANTNANQQVAVAVPLLTTTSRFALAALFIALAVAMTVGWPRSSRTVA